MNSRKIALLAPSCVLMGLLTLAYVILFVSSTSTMAPGTLSFGAPYDFSNYARFADDAILKGVVVYTIVYSIFVTAAVLLLAFPFCYAIVRIRRKWLRSLFLFVLVVTFFSGTITRAYSWLIVLGKRGPFNDLMLQLGLIDQPLSLIYNTTGVTIALLHYLFPYGAFVLIGTLKNLPEIYEEAAQDLGAGRLYTFIRVIIPQSLGGLGSAWILVYSLSLSTFVMPLLLGGGKVVLLSNAVYREVELNYDIPYAAAVAIIFVLASILTISLAYLLGKVVPRVLANRALASRA
ncbi:ABC transporter permease [Castellaniella sp.]|uniref:ABC transporter permease n=1 Tax=Castellaniella sp. TaxID=1955812 RepID=UPI003569C5A4